eukprot:364755-Chlamydomonas_euryale.AAC.1
MGGEGGGGRLCNAVREECTCSRIRHRTPVGMPAGAVGNGARHQTAGVPHIFTHPQQHSQAYKAVKARGCTQVEATRGAPRVLLEALVLPIAPLRMHRERPQTQPACCGITGSVPVACARNFFSNTFQTPMVLQFRQQGVRVGAELRMGAVGMRALHGCWWHENCARVLVACKRRMGAGGMQAPHGCGWHENCAWVLAACKRRMGAGGMRTVHGCWRHASAAWVLVPYERRIGSVDPRCRPPCTRADTRMRAPPLAWCQCNR